jgi:molybdopterin-binding protein
VTGNHQGRAVLELEGVTVRYGRDVAVEVDRLEVLEGEILVIIGPNGSGKSTLLRTLGLLEPPTTGAIRFKGEPVDARRLLAVRRHMASVFQDPLLIDATVFQNAALGLGFRRVPRADLAPRVQPWLDRLGIGHLGERRARTLSGGEAQRTALARALVLQPALLLLDEPFAALDQPTRETLIVELGRILRHDRITTVMVTHDRSEAMTLGDRVAVLMAGRIQQIDETARLFRSPVSEAVARFVGFETIVDGKVITAEDGLISLDAGGQTVEVTAAARPGDRVRLCLRPEDVALAIPGQITDGSPRNRLLGRVTDLLPQGAHVRVTVDCGFPLMALVTRRSVEDMRLTAGSPVVAIFKATAAHVLPDV